MTPIAHFEAVWARCGQLSALHAYLANNVSGVVQPDEILRAEWVARVCALDLYVHELVAQQMVAIFEGRRTPSPGFLRFNLTNDTMHRIRSAANASAAAAAFDLEVRDQLSRVTYQDPDRIADGVRLFSEVELWNEVASKLLLDPKVLKKNLSVVVRRRNQIAHEGDLQPAPPRQPWPIYQADLVVVANLIERIVQGIDGVT